MAVPGFQDFMLPLLQVAEKRKNSAFQTKDIRDEVANLMKISDEDLAEYYPETTILKYFDRMKWALTYLFQAGLFSRPKRGFYQITKKGLEALKAKPSHIDSKWLMQYPEFVRFLKSSRPPKKTVKQDEETEEDNLSSPDEKIAIAFDDLQKALAEELLERIQSSTPRFFEELVVQLLVKMGYGGSFHDAAKAVGKSHDGGIDGIIKEDKLGLDAIYLQAKRFASGNSVGRPEIQQFLGALQGHRATKGVFLTSSHFTKEAIEFAKNATTKIVLIDGLNLVRYMIEFDLGVSIRNTYQIKKIDEDFFEQE